MDRMDEQDWLALAAAEEPIYHGQHGTHAYTSVNDFNEQDEDSLITRIWTHTAEQVDASGEIEDDDYEGSEHRAETARRVAAALAILAFGVDFPVQP